MYYYCQCDVPLHTKTFSDDRKTAIAVKHCWTCCSRLIEPTKYAAILADWTARAQPYIGVKCKNAKCNREFRDPNKHLDYKTDQVVCSGCSTPLEIAQVCECAYPSVKRTVAIDGIPTVAPKCTRCKEGLKDYDVLLAAWLRDVTALTSPRCSCEPGRVCERCVVLLVAMRR